MKNSDITVFSSYLETARLNLRKKIVYDDAVFLRVYLSFRCWIDYWVLRFMAVLVEMNRFAEC